MEKDKTMRLINAEYLDVMTATCPEGMDMDSFMAGMDAVLDRIYKAPEVRITHLTRCKDCVHCMKDPYSKGGALRCKMWNSGTESEGYCHYGEGTDCAVDG